MHPILRNVLAVIGGLLIGGMINISIVSSSGLVVPLPEGMDPSDMESINAHIHEYTVMNYLMTFIAHALGVLVGALIASILGVGKTLKLGLIVGGFFLIGGVMAVYMLPESALWFKGMDILLAYIPMGWLGWKLSGRE